MNVAPLLVAALLALPFVPEADSADVSEVRSVAAFQAVEFLGAGHLIVAAGDPQSVTVTAAAPRLSGIRTTVRDGVLRIETSGSLWRDGNLEVVVHLPTLTQLTVLGAAQAELGGMDGGHLRIVLRGASQLRASGRVDHLGTQFEGASQADLRELSAGSVDLQVRGAAQVQLPASAPRAATRG